MIDIKEVLLNGFDRYHNYLKNFGTINKINQRSLLITFYLNQIVNGPMGMFITERDYNLIENLLYKLNNQSCMINYQVFKMSNSMLAFNDVNGDSKLTEVDTFRITETDSVRFHIL